MNRAAAIREGLRDGIPIGLGYFAVSFSLGIVAKNAGMTAFQAMIASATCSASAGEYAGFTLIAAHATLWEIALMTLIANARYLLMSCSFSQRLAPDMPFFHRLIMSFYLTDELYGIAVARPGNLNPFYSYGAILVASPCWTIGTGLGVIMGQLLPLRVVSAFSVALYGMFLAIIIPPCKENKVVAALVPICFLVSGLCAVAPVISAIPDGTRTILLTLLLSGGAALLFPIKEEKLPAEEDANV